MEAVKAEDLSTEELAVEDDESSMEEPEVKLGGEGLSKRDKSVTEVGRGGQLSAGREEAFWSFLVGIASGPWWGLSAFRLVVNCLGIVQFSSKADLERTDVEKWKWKVVEDLMDKSVEIRFNVSHSPSQAP
jgi:hypothetical protein